MTKKERETLKKLPAKEVRRMYEELVDELRNPAVTASSNIYNIGWADGYRIGTLLDIRR